MMFVPARSLLATLLVAAVLVGCGGSGSGQGGAFRADTQGWIFVHGIAASEGQVTASDTFLSNNGDGIVARRVRATNVFVRDSDRVGIVASKSIRGEHVEVRDNGVAGVYTARYKFTELIATTNGMASTFVGGGLVATRGGLLFDSLVDANTLVGAPADLVTGRSPRLANTSCAVSVVLTDSGPSGTWGVCSLD
jgi:hypothetical protein